jgi:hypothetical protein
MAGSESSGIAKPISEGSLCAPFVPVPNALAPSSQSVLPLQSSPHTIEPPFADQQHADDYTVPLPPKENQPSLRTQKLAMDDLQEDSSNVATLISNSAAPPARPPTADSTTVNHSATKISSPSAEDPSIPSLNVRNNASSGSPDSEAAMIEKKSRVISTIRSKGLRSYSDIFSAKPFTSAGVEQPKIAIKAGFRVNWFRIFPHIAAVTITAGVVQLSFRNAYWMDLQPPNKLISPGLTQGGALNFLQLAAKLHELLVLTSISSIVLHVVQLDLTGNAGLPLGMIANAFELGSAQFLRRRSFWSALWLRDPATQKRFPSGKFWLLCLFSTILVLLSGPSSAIAIIPSLNFFDLDRPFNQSVSPYYIWNHSMELWPEHITAKSLPSQLPNDPTNITHVMINCSDTSTTSFVTNCPSGGKKDIDTWSANLLLKNSDQGTNFTSLDFNGDNGRIVSVKSCVDSFSGHASGTSINTFISRALTIYVSCTMEYTKATLMRLSGALLETISTEAL